MSDPPVGDGITDDTAALQAILDRRKEVKMTVPIIIEGPDESGKTTLALALFGYFYPEAGLLKSPAGRSPEWYSYFDNWVGKVTSDATQPYLILDRVPEISEAVYGPIMRGSSRLNSPLGSLLNLPNGGTIIFCNPKPGPLEGTHYARGAKLLRPEDQGAIIGAYKIVQSFVTQFVPVYNWNYWRDDNLWNALLAKLPTKLPTRLLTFEEALEKGTEIVNNPRKVL